MPPAVCWSNLRRATDGRTGDRLSTVIRAVTTAGSTLPPDQVEAAIAAIALLLTEYEPSLLDGAADEAALRAWLHDVDTELTPGPPARRVARRWPGSNSNLDNEWYDAHAAGRDVAIGPRRCCAGSATGWPTRR